MTTRSQRAVIAQVLGASLLAAASLSIAGAASAQSDATSIHVSYADLNLRSDQGARSMLERIDDAAMRVCGGQPDIRQLAERDLFQKCKNQAVDRAVRDLDAPLVTAAAGRTGSTVVLAGR
jgi:UrcA family protein